LLKVALNTKNQNQIIFVYMWIASWLCSFCLNNAEWHLFFILYCNHRRMGHGFRFLLPLFSSNYLIHWVTRTLYRHRQNIQFTKYDIETNFIKKIPKRDKKIVEETFRKMWNLRWATLTLAKTNV
jgi:hypothetical protein